MIVESVAKILDDTALDVNDKEKNRSFFGNEYGFKTGPPSEVPNTMSGEHFNMS